MREKITAAAVHEQVVEAVVDMQRFAHGVRVTLARSAADVELTRQSDLYRSVVDASLAHARAHTKTQTRGSAT